MSESANTAEVYHFLTLVERVAGDDARVRRLASSLSPEQRSVVAHEVVANANSMEMDETGRYLIRESILRAILNVSD